MLLPPFLFPCINYMRMVCGNSNVFADAEAPFQRQTHRNRYEVCTANGIIKLVVPIHHSARKQQGLKFRDVKIAYDHPWQMQHIRTLKSAYNSASYFAFYEEELNAILTKNHVFLLDLNLEAMDFLTRHLSLNPLLLFSGNREDEKKIYDEMIDNPDAGKDLSYFQVFSERHGFVPNLSTLDLLFNLGPVEARRILTENPIPLT